MSTAEATLYEQAYQAMRQMIVRGELPAGKWIRKRAMASRLRMSATPVVEALRRLENEGLVQSEPQWGARVRVFTVEEIVELAGMRSVLEGFVARCCAERLTDEQIRSLREIAVRVDEIDLSYADPANATFGTAATEDMQFHLKLAEEAQLSLLHREIERLQVLKATCRTWIVPPVRSTVSHERIMEAISSRDPQQAETVMRRHIDENTEVYVPRLRQRFGEGPVIWNDLDTGRASKPARGQNPGH